MSQLRFIFVLAICIFFGSMYANPGGKIQVALLLDTSNSMDGLINQAKTQLWKVVNEFALARQDGKMPELEIALYEYGNDGLSRNDGYIRKVAPLTTDLDLISEELFKLTTNGGSEYCGWVIRSATEALDWSKDPDVLKLIFIAGNEPFSQGSVDYEKACRDAIAGGIVVNTIFCGNFDEGVRTHWKKGADLSDGKYFNIDQNQIVVNIDAPQDEEIRRLNDALNETYIPYGSEGTLLKKRQLEQDSNAEYFSAAIAAQRTASKASAFYQNTSWDLVDAVQGGAVDLKKIDPEELPQEMQEMTLTEKENFVSAKAKERQEIQEKIKALDLERRKYIAAKQREQSVDGTLDSAIIKALHEQAAEKNYRFD